MRSRSSGRSSDRRRLDPLRQAVVAFGTVTFAILPAGSFHPRWARPMRFANCRISRRRGQARERTLEADCRKRRCARGGGGRNAGRICRSTVESRSGRVLDRSETRRSAVLVVLSSCNIVETLAPSPEQGWAPDLAATSRRMNSTRRERRRRRAITRRNRLPPLLVVQGSRSSVVGLRGCRSAGRG